MADELEIRPPTPADLPALGRLYEAVKGRPRPESVTGHRLFDTPWGDSVSLIAVDGDVCASMAVYWPVAMRAGDEVVPGAQGMEAVTHPDYRNRPRLFLTLAKQGRDLALERMQLHVHVPERALDQAHEARGRHVSRRGGRLGNRPRAAPGASAEALAPGRRGCRRADDRRAGGARRPSSRAARSRADRQERRVALLALLATRPARTTSGSSSGMRAGR